MKSMLSSCSQVILMLPVIGDTLTSDALAYGGLPSGG